jgi:hypothetical protein
MNEIMGGG